MYLIRGQSNLELFKKKFPSTCVSATIGNFDGIHLGHQSIIEQVKRRAKENNLLSLVFITEPHAEEYFLRAGTVSSAPPRIMPWRAKFEHFKLNGIDFCMLLKFDRKFKSMSPNNFLSHILEKMQVKSLIVGDDFKFGKNRAGNFEMLKEWGKAKDVYISNIETFSVDGERVSSTMIRKAISEGNFILAKKLLGRAYAFSGKVVYGNQLGRKIGVPTANIWIPNQKLPISGVYAVKCFVGNQCHGGIANMGIRPTVGGDRPILEVHIFNFQKDIYGQRITVQFQEKIREEKKFEDIDKLKSQIFTDIKTAKTILDA